MPPISSLGVGAALDTQALLAQLQAAENTRLVPYQKQQTKLQNEISAWGQISSALTALQGTSKKLGNDAFNTLTVSTNEAFTATANTSAIAGNYDVTITQLATSHSIATEMKPVDPDKDLGTTDTGTRTVTITQKDGTTMNVKLSDDQTSLNDIAKAINKEDGDVKASVVESDDGTQLVLTSKSSGKENKITSVNVPDDAALQDVLGFDDSDPETGMHEEVPASDAKLTVNGKNYTRADNTITDIIPGVTLNLNKVSESTNDVFKSEKLSLSRDNTATSTTVQEFVTNYNALINLTNTANKFTPDESSSSTASKDDGTTQPTTPNGPLMGDSALRRMVGEIRGEVNGSYGASDADIQALSDIGITIDSSTGLMTLDQSKLDRAIADNPGEIQKMFVGTDSDPGMAVQLTDIIAKYVGDPEQHIDGLIKETSDGLNDQLKIVKTQIDNTQKLIDAQVQRYRVQFQNLDSVMSQMTATSDSLASMLSQYG